ncbi:MAG TPA: DNA recombination protein RmuC [Planctomycetota bacterium]|jgi:DNA recombination protein RmuC
MVEGLAIVACVLLLAVLVLQILILRNQGVDLSPLQTRLDGLASAQERMERSLREEVARNREEQTAGAKGLREEVGANLKGVGDTLTKNLGEISNAQKNQLDTFGLQLNAMTQTLELTGKQHREEVSASLKNASDSLVKTVGAMSDVQSNQLQDFSLMLRRMTDTIETSAQKHREEVAAQLKAFSDSIVKSMGEMAGVQKGQMESFGGQLEKLTESNAKKAEELRAAVEAKLLQMQTENAAKLEEMRKTVDEKLQGTLDKRLGESFKLVSERLEQVHKGLGEMQTLATGVGDLKKVLTNVKTRGTWGEMQLGNLLEQVLSPEQYAKNVATKKGDSAVVEFAVKLPGKDEMEGSTVWLPIDAKFPKESYERLVDALERADAAAAELAAKELELRIKGQAKDIRDKYLDPPNTTDFGILFLPIEGLYAEVLRRPGLVEVLQRDYRVNVTGPTTLAALLNSLQMGFRTLAIQKRSSEVWTVLGAVKTEFGKFGEFIDKLKKKLEEATSVVDSAGVRTRAIEKKLKAVQELPAPEAAKLLDVSTDDEPKQDPVLKTI